MADIISLPLPSSILSPRREQILDLLAEGYDVATIATILKIAPRTVREDLRVMFCKLKFSTGRKRVRLIQWWLQWQKPHDEKSSLTLHLSPQHFAVARLVANGCSNKEVAAALKTTVGVVKNMVRNVLNAVGCWNSFELALYVMYHPKAFPDPLLH